MELSTARNLKIELRERPEDIALKMKDVILQCAEGLDYLHEQGWVHCDVKPDNFLVDDQGHVKLIDFSIAERIKKGGLGSLFGKKAVRGTRSYMAPEQIRKKNVDRRTDVYGFGCMIFEMIAGKTPYTASNPDDLLRLHLTAPIPNLAASGSTRELAALVSAMIAKDPAARPANMRDVILEIRKISIYRAGYRPEQKTPKPD
jgi:serine/threonine protein kinase